MSSFICYGDIGVWATNSERDAFLDWFAQNRCTLGDKRLEFCTSEGYRWPGCGVELDNLIPRGQILEINTSELAAAEQLGPNFAELLRIIAAITRGDWLHQLGSHETEWWRPSFKALEARWKREEQELLNGPVQSSSFGPDALINFSSRDKDLK